MNVNVPWRTLQTVLLDMDGTLLDLYFDSVFWKEHVPRRYAETRGLDIPTATAALTPIFEKTAGTLDWYCVDYWSRTLGLDIAELKRELAHLIRYKPHTVTFLEQLRQAEKRVLLVTNAHPKSLALKLEKTTLGDYLDGIVCAHDLGHAKEEPYFWHVLGDREAFDPSTTLLVDDNVHALRAARHYGIANLLAISRPSPSAPRIDTGEFPAIEDFDELFPELASASRT